MKWYLTLALGTWISQVTASHELQSGGDSQYQQTRSLSGVDYGIEYNLNYPKTVEPNVGGTSHFRKPLFDWKTNTKSTNKIQNISSDYDTRIMTDDASGERNRSNIWWPWSNYEEWALTRKHGLRVAESNETKQSKTHFVAARRGRQEGKKRRKKRRKRKRKRKKDNDTTSSHSVQNDSKTVAEANDLQTRGKIIAEKESTKSKNPTNQSLDNNEMNNEIQQPRFNYYDSIPVADTRNSLVDRIKTNWNSDYYFDKGYTKRNFTDVNNECLINNGGCEGLCIHAPGSNECHCPSGFRVDGKKCIDINECLLRNGHGPCQDKCINMWGSYHCNCENIPGTRLAIDGHTCEDIDECKEQTAGCSHECINTVGSAFCLCPAGYMLDADWKTCKDIDECTMTELQELRCENGCKNTIGSYACL